MKKKLIKKGLRYDEGKPRMDLIPPELLFAIAEVLTYGAEKYAPRNWERGMIWGKEVYAPLIRHLEKWKKGEERDEESGLTHLAHAACNIAFLVALTQRQLGIDDRKIDWVEYGFYGDSGKAK